MHMDNAWLLKKAEIIIILPEELSEYPQDLFMFCGSLNFKDICHLNDINNFVSTKFIFAASYLIINDSYMVSLLKIAGSVSLKTNKLGSNHSFLNTTNLL